jgi:hypothetical protein
MPQHVFHLKEGLVRLQVSVDDALEAFLCGFDQWRRGQPSRPADHRIDASKFANIRLIAFERIGTKPRCLVDERLVQVLSSSPLTCPRTRLRLGCWRQPSDDDRQPSDERSCRRSLMFAARRRRGHGPARVVAAFGASATLDGPSEPRLTEIEITNRHRDGEIGFRGVATRAHTTAPRCSPTTSARREKRGPTTGNAFMKT